MLTTFRKRGVMNQFVRVSRLAILLILCILLIANSVDAKKRTKKSKNKFIPKSGFVHKSLMFNRIEKRFIVTRETRKSALRKLAEIENTGFIIDGEGSFPAKSVITTLAPFEKQINLVLPLKFSQGHKRRLGALNNVFDVTFRIKKDTFTNDVANRALSMGPRRKVFEMGLADLGSEVSSLLRKKVRHYEVAINVPEDAVIGKKKIKILNKLNGIKEIRLPANYPVKEVSKLKKISQVRLLVRVQGVGPNPELVKAINKLKKVDAGFIVRGLIKKTEGFNYMSLDNFRILEIAPEDWKITDSFIKLMNSKGEI